MSKIRKLPEEDISQLLDIMEDKCKETETSILDSNDDGELII